MLKKYRENKGFTQTEIADLAGIDRKTLFRIENNKTITSISNYAKLVVALGMTNEEIAKHIRKIANNEKDI